MAHRLGEHAGDDLTWLLYAGRLSPEKNLPLLIDTLTKLEDRQRRWRLVVVGDGPMAGALRADAERRARRRVLMWGHVAERETLARLYASCDVFVHPNPREPFGIAPLEAMASGASLVAPAAGGVRSYANDDNAWLVEPTGEAFARAVVAACEPGVLRDGRLARARATAAMFDWTRVARMIFGVYDVLHARRRRAWERLGPLSVQCSPIRGAR
jgi:glycosyltransferase involved in cell wall biosynthesis